MRDTGATDQSLDAFAVCGASMWLQQTSTKDDLRLVCNCCKNRWCVPCAMTRARRINANLTDHLKGRTTRFMTLTLRHSDTPLADQLTRLYSCFHELRRKTWWKSVVKGGIAFPEAKISSRDGRWHVHLHILFEGTWLSQKELSFEWHKVTGDSTIVDVRAVDDSGRAAHYVTKYVTKPADDTVWTVPDKLQEMILAMRGRRLCLPFGTWQKINVTRIPDDGREWSSVMSLDSMIHRTAEGDEEAVRWFVACKRKWPSYPWPALDLPPPTLPNQLDLL